MPRQILKNLGLDDNEIKIYLSCLTDTQSTIWDISKKSWIKRTSLYTMIKKLKHKWYITTYQKDWATVYNSVDPNILTEKLKERASEYQRNILAMDKIAPMLSNLTIDNEKSNIHYYEWIEWLKAMCADITSSNPTVKALIRPDDFTSEALKYLNDFYFPIREKQQKKFWPTIILAKEKHIEYVKNTLKNDNSDKKYLPVEKAHIKATVQIYDNKVAIYMPKKWKERGIIIEDTLVHQTFDQIFNFMWSVL